MATRAVALWVLENRTRMLSVLLFLFSYLHFFCYTDHSPQHTVPRREAMVSKSVDHECLQSPPPLQATFELLDSTLMASFTPLPPRFFLGISVTSGFRKVNDLQSGLSVPLPLKV